MREVRVRFAPSPTGALHIGGVRTALYNYLFAKHHGGKNILRIEDTDQTRFVPGAEDYIKKSLDWCGIKFDESPELGGDYAPYKQSERKNIYKKYALQLVENGFAYYAFDTPEELDSLRKQYEAEKKVFQYSIENRNNLNNSLNMSEEELNRKLSENIPHVIRVKIPENETITLNDIIRGEVVVDSNQLDDKVLYKSDGMPTYHLANIVDDYLMKISHVIRGEEWLPSAPLHVLLYRFLGWADLAPQFAHLPLLLKPDGNGKLSKRDGDRLGFPVFPMKWTDPASGEVSSGYKESGYLPEAFINMLAFLGWNPGTEQEIFSMEQLIQSFSLDRVSKSGAKFNLEKALWYNHKYLSEKTPQELAEILKTFLDKNNIVSGNDKNIKICSLISERINLIPDIWEQSEFFFIKPQTYDEKAVGKTWKQNTSELLLEFVPEIEKIETFTTENIHESVKNFIEKKQIGMGQVMNPIRIALVGKNSGPGMMDTMEILGKTETIERIKKCIDTLK